jgi:hypothetical protein
MVLDTRQIRRILLLDTRQIWGASFSIHPVIIRNFFYLSNRKNLFFLRIYLSSYEKTAVQIDKSGEVRVV